MVSNFELVLESNDNLIEARRIVGDRAIIGTVYKVRDLLNQISALKIEQKELLKGKTLIGTCGDCEWWRKGNPNVFDKCVSPKNLNVSIGGNMNPDLTFGCIHWQEKTK